MRLTKILNSLIRKNKEPLVEMAIIGWTENDKNQQELEIRVYEEPLGNPSIHVISKKDNYEVVLRIKDLQILEWKYNKKKLKDIPIADKQEIIEFLKSERIENELSMWKYFVAVWNDHNTIKLNYEDKPEWLKR